MLLRFKRGPAAASLLTFLGGSAKLFRPRDQSKLRPDVCPNLSAREAPVLLAIVAQSSSPPIDASSQVMALPFAGDGDCVVSNATRPD